MDTMNPYKLVAGKIRSARGFTEVADILKNFPECLKSHTVVEALLTNMRQILARSSEEVVNLPFMMTVLTLNQPEVMKLPPSRSLGMSTGYASCAIMTAYARALAEKRGKDAFINIERDSTVNTHFIKNAPIQKIRDTSGGALMGILFFCINYTGWDTYDQAIWLGIQRYYRMAFLDTFADVAIPMTSPDKVIRLINKVWGSHEEVDANDDPKKFNYRESFPSMLCRDPLVAFATDLEKYVDTDPDEVQDALQILVTMANMAKDQYIRENYFYEYSEMLSEFYPLEQKRTDIFERYVPYFGENDTLDYMAGIYDAFFAGFSDVNAFRDSGTTEYHAVHREIERIVWHIKAVHPEVKRQVLDLFFHDVIQAHSNHFRGASDGALLVSDSIISAVYNENAEENPAFLNALSATMATLEQAMEADQYGYPDFQDDYKGEKIDHSGSGNDSAGTDPANTAENRDLHKPNMGTAYDQFKKKAGEVDQKLTQVTGMIKKALAEGKQAILINGQPKSIIWTLFKLYAGFGIFRSSKMLFLLTMITNHYLKKGTRSQRIKLLSQINDELVMVDEKIQDATADQNREAKYELMRTKQGLEAAKKRLLYGVGRKTSGRANLSSNVGGYRG